ncbi:hypothetical protein DFJ73DRAFT_794174 [Zopfochytrium polystomum]|nr:hypothetical protein DFJ73DRAFT_794174 [Zopfochytrium polystomum]
MVAERLRQVVVAGVIGLTAVVAIFSDIPSYAPDPVCPATRAEAAAAIDAYRTVMADAAAAAAAAAATAAATPADTPKQAKKRQQQKRTTTTPDRDSDDRAATEANDDNDDDGDGDGDGDEDVEDVPARKNSPAKQPGRKAKALVFPLAVPNYHYVHTGLHPWIDRWNCETTLLFRAAVAGRRTSWAPSATATATTSSWLAMLTGPTTTTTTGGDEWGLGYAATLHAVLLFAAFMHLVAVERTRSSTRFPSSSLVLVGFGAQAAWARGAAVALVWLIPWFRSHPDPARAAHQGALRPRNLGSDVQLHFVGAAATAFALLSAAAADPRVAPPQRAAAVFAAVVAWLVLPLALASSKLFSGPRPRNARAVASRTAVAWYRFAQTGYAAPGVIAFLLAARAVLRSRRGFAVLTDFVGRALGGGGGGGDGAGDAFAAGYFVKELAALAACAGLWVLAELGWPELRRFVVASVFVGPASALMGAALARELVIEAAMVRERPDIPVMLADEQKDAAKKKSKAAGAGAATTTKTTTTMTTTTTTTAEAKKTK